MRLKNYFLALLGIILIVVSYFLAIVKNFHYFYSILVIGNFLLYNSLYYLFNKKYFLNLKSWVKFYLALIPIGIIADMFMARMLSKLHHYPFYGPINYVILYLVIYPLGGLILVYCYFLIKSLFKNQKNKKINSGLIKNVLIIGLILFIFLVLITLIYRKSMPLFGFWIFAWPTFAGFFLTNLINFSISKNCLIGEIISLQRSVILSIIFTMFFNCFLHEIPNTFVYEWVYHQNFPLMNIMIFRIPLLVIILGWLAMTIITVSYFQLLKNLKYIKD